MSNAFRGPVKGDWTCAHCNFKVFANKHTRICPKCQTHRDKEVNNTQPALPFYAAADSVQQVQPRTRAGDWTCPKCQFHLFAKKEYCGKCKVDRDGNPVNSAASSSVPHFTSSSSLQSANSPSSTTAGSTSASSAPAPAASVPERSSPTSHDAGDAAFRCVVCLDAPRDCLFVHCKHVAVCMKCAERVDFCPICRVGATAESKQRIFVS